MSQHWSILGESRAQKVWLEGFAQPFQPRKAVGLTVSQSTLYFQLGQHSVTAITGDCDNRRMLSILRAFPDRFGSAGYRSLSIKPLRSRNS